MSCSFLDLVYIRNLTKLALKRIIHHMERAVEKAREPLDLEISEDLLTERGWRLYPRTDGHVFTIFLRQGINLEEALSSGRGLSARHQMKDVTGELRPESPSHKDLLRKGRLQNEEIMDTEYHTSIGHHTMIVLTKDNN